MQQQQQYQQQQQWIDIPEKCLAYSANWYLNQISAYDERTNLFAFGSNSDIYIINYQEKKYETIIYNQNIREKITCVKFLEKQGSQKKGSEEILEDEEMKEEILILAGSNSGNVYIYEYKIKSKKYELLETQNLVQNTTIVYFQVDNTQYINQFQQIIRIQAQLQNGSTFSISFDILARKIINIRLFIQSTQNLKLKLSSSFNHYNINQNNQNISSSSSSSQIINATSDENQNVMLSTKINDPPLQNGNIQSIQNANDQNSHQVNGSIYFFEEGQVIIYENNTQIMTHKIEGKILTIDEVRQDENVDKIGNKQFIMLKKQKNSLYINVVDVQCCSDYSDDSVSKENTQAIPQRQHTQKDIEDTQIQIQRSSEQKRIKDKYVIKNVLDIEVFFIYTKKQNDLMQSSFSIHSLDGDNFILTGKIGDIYIFNLGKLMQHASKSNKVTINPLSAQFTDTFYTKLPDSNHYDGIFAISQTLNNQLITLSTDRKISFFNINYTIKKNDSSEGEVRRIDKLDHSNFNNNNDNDKIDEEIGDGEQNSDIPFSLQLEWQLNCLGGKVNSLAVSQIEKELVYMSCLDHTIRVWDSSKIHDQLYVKDYYKRLDQYKVKEMILHPTFENMMLLLIEDNPKKLVGYDLFKEKVSFEYISNRDILNLKWINNDQVEELQNIQFQQISSSNPQEKGDNSNNQGSKQENQEKEEQIVEKPVSKQIKVESDKIEVKEKSCLMEGDNQRLLVFKKGGYASLIDLSTGQLSLEDYSLCENKQNVQQFDFDTVGEENQIFGVFAQLGCISFYHDYQYKQFQNIHKNVVKSIAFKQCKSSEQLIICCASLDRKISVYSGQKNEISTFEFITYLKHEYPVERVRFSPIDGIYYLLSICQNQNTVQVYDLLPTLNLTYQSAQSNNISLEYKNIRGHRGYVNDALFSPLDPNLIITCSDDQTVKFWQIDKIINKSFPKRKKNKSKGQSENDIQEVDGENMKKQTFSNKYNNNNNNNNQHNNQNNRGGGQNNQNNKYQHNKNQQQKNNQNKGGYPHNNNKQFHRKK